MTDIQTDEVVVVVNIVHPKDVDIQNVVIPSIAVQNEEMTITFDMVNNGTIVPCYAKIVANGTQIHRWDGEILTGETHNISIIHTPTGAGNLTIEITIGYTD